VIATRLARDGVDLALFGLGGIFVEILKDGYSTAARLAKTWPNA